ncbi:purine-nucleoside phosphorylase [candidate division WOR-3 bacterium]|nr:purine-nucleoside phosphorylase [candidate division WOR-3 bacterium]
MEIKGKEQEYKRLSQSKEFILGLLSFDRPDVGIILGTGLGGVADEIEAPVEIPYEDIPNFPVSTVKGHEGMLIGGKLKGKKIVAMKGRFHFYEGYDMGKVTYGAKLLCFLGIETFIVSNAAGGVNPQFSRGDIMIITDHINLFPRHPLRGPNDERLGPRFPDMYNTYDKDLVKLVEDTALDIGIKVRKGVYLGLQGPTFETAAEYRMIRMLGADAVGMSTVPEVIIARWMGTKVLGLSIISDLGLPDALEPINHELVLKAAGEASPKLSKLVVSSVERL